MAIIAVNEKHEGRTATHDTKTRKYTRTFVVETDDLTDSEHDVITAIPVAIYDAHPDDTAALAKSGTARVSGDFVWEVSVSYDTEVDDEDDPLQRPTEYSWQTRQIERVVTVDANGDAIKNSAGDPIPGVLRPSSMVALTATKNFATFDGSTAFAYVDRINSGSFQGAATKTLLLDDISAQTTTEGDTTFWRVSFSFLYNQFTWTYKIVDRGFNELDNGTHKKIYINGKEPSEPVLLDQNGKAIPNGTPNILEFELYDTADFSSLGL